MITQLINYIYQNQRLQQFTMKKNNQKIEIESKQYVISIEFYDCQVVEEIIYDKVKEDVYFYFHHECFNTYQTKIFIDDFLNIVFSLLDKDTDITTLWGLKDYMNLNDNPYYLQNQF